MINVNSKGKTQLTRDFRQLVLINIAKLFSSLKTKYNTLFPPNIKYERISE